MDAGATGPSPPNDGPMVNVLTYSELRKSLSPARSERFRVECARNDKAQEHMTQQIEQMEIDFKLRKERVLQQIKQNQRQWHLINGKYTNLLHKELVAAEKLKAKEEKKAQQQAYAFTD